MISINEKYEDLKINIKSNTLKVLAYSKKTLLSGITKENKVFFYDNSSEFFVENNTCLSKHASRNEIVFFNTCSLPVKLLCTTENIKETLKSYLIIVYTKSLQIFCINSQELSLTKEFKDDIKDVCLNENETTQLIVAGQYFLQVIDIRGNEILWTLLPGSVESVSFSLWFFPLTEEFDSVFLVSCDDCDVKVFKDDEIINEISFSDVVKSLCWVTQDFFAYILTEGTVGVYENSKRVWRLKVIDLCNKAKNYATSFISFGNTVCDYFLAVTWKSGKIDVRKYKTGDVIFKDHSPLNQHLSIFISQDKSSFFSSTASGKLTKYSFNLDSEIGEKKLATEEQLDSIEKCTTLKKSLQLEKEEILKSFADEERGNGKLNLQFSQHQSFSESLHLLAELIYEESTSSLNTLGKIFLNIRITCSPIPEYKIKCIEFHSEKLFKDISEEEYIILVEENCSQLRILPPKNVLYHVICKAHVQSNEESEILKVIVQELRIPPFSSFYSLDEGSKAGFIHSKSSDHSDGFAKVLLPDWITAKHINEWASKAFLRHFNVKDIDCGLFEAFFISIHNNTSLRLKFSDKDSSFFVYFPSSCVGADVMKSIFNEFSIQHLNAFFLFSKEISEIKNLFSQFSKMHESYEGLDLNIDHCYNLCLDEVVSAEVALEHKEMQLARNKYSTVFNLCHKICDSLSTRGNVNASKMEASKRIHTIIQNSSCIKVGSFRMEFLSQCKEALKVMDVEKVIKVLSCQQI